MVTTTQPLLAPTALVNRVRAVVARRVRRGALPAQDFDDAVQSVLLDLYRRSTQRPPPLLPAPLSCRVIDSSLSNVVRHRRAARRCPPSGTTSLELFGEVSDFRLEAHLRDETLRHDLAEFLRRLPPDLRELAEYLNRYSLRRVARLLGISRSTLRRRLNRVRQRFEALGWISHG